MSIIVTSRNDASYRTGAMRCLLKIIKNMIYCHICILLMISALTGNARPGPDAQLKSSVVKIYSIYANYNYSQPWQKRSQGELSGSGCIIEGNRILTNAHVVSNSTFISVRRADQSKKYNARVQLVAHECDLAVLTVGDESFFSGTSPIPVSTLPEIRDRVAVYGFPVGGEELSITEGVVSRIENVKFAHSSARLLSCQIDAAINSGNSGGPVIKGDRIVGVAFQAMESGQNIGYIIATPVIRHFLEDIADGRYDGIPDLGISVQNMENPDLRALYGIGKQQTGVRVSKIAYSSPADGILWIGDIILSIDGMKVGNDASVEFRNGERTFFIYAVQKRHINDTIPIVILRRGRVKRCSVRLTKTIESFQLVSREQYDTVPTYYIAGGLVFEPLTKNYLEEWGPKWYDEGPTLLLNYYFNGKKSSGRKEIVLLTKVLADEINVGYHDVSNLVISKINNRPIGTMDDVVRAIETCKKKFHVIETENGPILILSRRNVREFTTRILQRYQIAADRSPDLRRKNMDDR